MKAAIDRSVDGQIWLNGRLVEINPDYLRTEDLLSSPRLLDGFMPCPSCKDVLVLEGFCANCRRLERELEASFAEYDPGKPASRIAVGVVFLGALCCAMFVLTGLWFGVRGAIGFCLEHSTK